LVEEARNTTGNGAINHQLLWFMIICCFNFLISADNEEHFFCK